MPGIVNIVAVLVFAQGPVVAEETNWLAKTEALIASDSELQRLHEGYREFLQSDSAAADAERGFTNLLQSPNFRRLYARFEEALAAHPELQDAFDAYYRELADDNEMADAIETLSRVVSENKTAGAPLADAMRYLRSHPEEALKLLDRDGFGDPLNEPVREIKRVLGDGKAKEALVGALTTLQEDADAGGPVVEFWRRVAEKPEVAESSAEFEDRVLRYPSEFQAWHRRNIALADEPDLREWNRYWHRLIRRQPELERWYANYLKQAPESNSPSSAAGDEKAGPRWPPSGKPRRLPAAGVPKPRVSRPAPPEIRRPQRPGRAGGLKGPTSPSRPIRPSRPAPETENDTGVRGAPR